MAAVVSVMRARRFVSPMVQYSSARELKYEYSSCTVHTLNLGPAAADASLLTRMPKSAPDRHAACNISIGVGSEWMNLKILKLRLRMRLCFCREKEVDQ
jgi:hypothetical protein